MSHQAEDLLAARQRALVQSSAPTKPPHLAEYAHLRQRQVFLAGPTEAQLPPAVNLFDGIQQMPQAAQQRLRTLERVTCLMASGQS